jgi:hypothetical protein
VLVETESGVPGLVRGVTRDAGATVRVGVVERDDVEGRFAALLA